MIEINGYKLFKPSNEANNKYWRYVWTDSNGKRLQRSTKCEDLASAKRFVKDLPPAGDAPSHRMTLSQFLEPYYGPNCPRIEQLRTDGKNIGEAWIRQQRAGLVKYVFGDPIGKKLVLDLVAGDFEDWKSRKKREGVSVSVLNDTIGAMKASFVNGIHRGLLKWSPLTYVSEIKTNSKPIEIIQLEDYKKLFDSLAPWTPAENPNNNGNAMGKVDPKVTRAFFLTLALTGLRASECSALHWNQFEGDILKINQAFKRFEGIGLPKWNKVREIPIVDILVKELNELPRISEHIFCYSSGKPLGDTWRKNAFDRALEVTGLVGITPKSFRHALNSHLIAMGADNRMIKAYLGWEQTEILVSSASLDRVQAGYTHWDPDKLKPIVDFISKIMNKN